MSSVDINIINIIIVIIIYINSIISEFMVDHRSYTHNLSSWEIKAWKKIQAWTGLETHDLYDTGAMLYRLSYQAIWELVTLSVRYITVEVENCFGKIMVKYTFLKLLMPMTLQTYWWNFVFN